jgi:hypothetical protein
MARLPLLLTAAAAAVAAALTPAIAGLTGNPSFSERLPVNVPARADEPSFPRRAVTPAPRTPDRSPTAIPTVTAPSSADRREPEPGGDGHRRGGRRRGGGSSHQGEEDGHHGGSDG